MRNKRNIMICIVILVCTAVLGITGCSDTKMNKSNLQQAYFTMSDESKKNKAFTQKDLEKITNKSADEVRVANSENDLNRYLFINGANIEESLEVLTGKKDNEIYLLKYNFDDKIIMTNSLKDGVDFGYNKGLSVRYKVNTLENQEEILQKILKEK